MFRNPVAPGRHWEQPSSAQLLTWKTSTCAPGTWLVFVAKIHREKKKKNHLAASLVYLQGRNPGKNIFREQNWEEEFLGEWDVILSSRQSCLQPGRSPEDNACVPGGGVGNWEGRKEVSSPSSPREKFLGKIQKGILQKPVRLKTLQNEPWNTNTAKSLPTRAPHGTTIGADGLVAALYPKLSLSPCTFEFVYLGEFSLIWEGSGAVSSTGSALALG